MNNLDLEHPEENEVYEEVAPLLSRMYKQNREIKNQIDTARRQQEEFSIITENMQEGLVVIDRYTMILSGNSSVWKLFHVNEPKSGESVYVLNRSEEFQSIIAKALAGKHNEAVLKVDGSDIHVVANPVMRENQVEGAVLLLVNVTEKLERKASERVFRKCIS